MDILDKETMVTRLAEHLTRYPLRFAMLYGSYSRGRATPVSDVDLAVYVDTFDDFLRIAAEIDAAFPERRVDIVQLKEQPALIYYEILATGTKIDIRDEDFFYAEKLRVMREYLDFRFTYERLMEDMLQRIDRGGYGKRAK